MHTKKDLRQPVCNNEPSVMWRAIRDAFNRTSWSGQFSREFLAADIFAEDIKSRFGEYSCRHHSTRTWMLCDPGHFTHLVGLSEFANDLEKRVAPIIEVLQAEEMIKPLESPQGETSFEIAPRGNTLRLQKMLRPITRQRADDLLAKVLQIAEGINQDPCASKKIQAIYVYGSYLSDKPLLGDLDLAIELERAGCDWNTSCKDFAAWKEHDRIYAARFGRRTGKLAIRKQLQISPSVSLCGWSDLEYLVLIGQATCKRVFGGK